jgi:hypothetical protein
LHLCRCVSQFFHLSVDQCLCLSVFPSFCHFVSLSHFISAFFCIFPFLLSFSLYYLSLSFCHFHSVFTSLSLSHTNTQILFLEFLTFLKTLDFSRAFFCDICLKERSFLQKKKLFI